MLTDDEWNLIRSLRPGRGRTGGTGLARLALFGALAITGLAVLATPYIEKQARARGLTLAREQTDAVTTGSVSGPREVRTYTIRRSVLQASPNDVCIIGVDGRRSGACD